jgi:hypothetical protein
MARSDRADAGLLLALGVALLGWFLGLFVLHGLRFPVGPDAPVYLWWIRLAGHDGLSAVGDRPGVPALALVFDGTLHRSPVAILASLECAVSVAIGLGAAALVRSSVGGRAAWALAGGLAGTFAVHLAAGYLSTLVFAASFLAAAVLLTRRGRRSTVGAAIVLGAGGLAHPLFFLVGLAILAVTALLAVRGARTEARRLAAVCVGAGALVGACLLALLVGPPPLPVDTSRDAFLRRAGLGDVLASAYRYRFVHRWTRYVEWASIPLAVIAFPSTTGFVGRFLRAWGLVTIVGVAASLATGWLPADRFITFGFVVPILAALGLVRLWRWLEPRGRAIALGATGTLTIAMLAGSLIAWGREDPFLSTLEVERVDTAARYAAGSDPGTTLVFFVNQDSPVASFLATRAENVIRAAMPPDRIRDVVIVVPRGAAPSTERTALSRTTLADADRAIEAHGGRFLDLLVVPFDRVDLARLESPAPFRRAARGVFLSPSITTPASISDPLEPSSPGVIALATLATLALLLAVGYGWARATALDRWTSAVLAPAFGTSALIVLGIALERLGLPLKGSVGPTLVSALAAGGGYLAWLVLERRSRSEPAPKVEQ